MAINERLQALGTFSPAILFRCMVGFEISS